MTRSVAVVVLMLLSVACEPPAPDPSAGREPEPPLWPSPDPTASPKVLLVGWDGVRPDVLREVPTPNLDALAAAGSFSETARTARPTVSGPCWSRMLQAIRERPSFPREDWLVLVTTDHGRTDEGGHGGESPQETTVFYLASGPSARVGTTDPSPTVVDLVPTALAHLGIPLDPAWQLDGRVAGLER